MLFIVDSLRFPPSRLARKNMLEKIDKKHVVSGVCRSDGCIHFTECFSTADESVQFI